MSNRMLRKLLFISVIGLPSATAADTLGDMADIQTVADWLIDQQYTDSAHPGYGAIKIHHDPGHIDTVAAQSYWHVVPYFSNLAVAGLLQSPVSDKLHVAEHWIDWYLDHLDPSSTPSGVVLDHWYLSDGSGETTCPTGIDSLLCDYDDASDSYAATFLGAARECGW